MKNIIVSLAPIQAGNWQICYSNIDISVVLPSGGQRLAMILGIVLVC